jgi:hypothetical protein
MNKKYYVEVKRFFWSRCRIDNNTVINTKGSELKYYLKKRSFFGDKLIKIYTDCEQALNECLKLNRE